MAEEEDADRQQLIALHETRFGAFIPLIQRQHVAGFYARQPIWLIANLGIEKIRAEAEAMERKAEDFYRKAAARSSDAASRKLLGDLAASEARHKARAEGLSQNLTSSGAAQEEGFQAKRQFILTWAQPGLAGLMDGSVSTLAPIFATQNSHTTFLVGLAAALGAGVSMAFTEAASDDEALSGRGSPLKRGFAAGVMTKIGGLGHALPYLIALIVVFIELWAIAWIQNWYMQTPFFRAAFQVVLGGSLVFGIGIVIGSG